MATLRNIASGSELTLRARVTIGRGARADVRLAGSGCSKEHATIQWDGSEWSLRDVGSRNGTRVNGNLLLGQSWRLVPGDELTFGDPDERWLWLEAAAPRAAAVRADGTTTYADGTMLLLPDERAPSASLYLKDGRWELDYRGSVRAVEDGETVQVAGHYYRLELPCPEPSLGRTRTVAGERSVRDARIELRPSLDEEFVAVNLALGSATQALPARAFNYMLLLLARSRAEDSASGVVCEEAGWTYADELARKLDVGIERLNVDIHRARRAVERLRLGNAPMFVDANRIVERRRTTTQLRLGVRHIVL